MRVLGIEPNAKGLGFAVLEGNDTLIAWGGVRRNEDRLSSVNQLLEIYVPELVVFEDWTALDSRRSVKIKKFLHKCALLCARRKVIAKTYSKRRLIAAFNDYEVKSGHEIATFIAHLFPETLPNLPAKRKPWSGDDLRISFFMAIAFCLVEAEKRGYLAS